MLEGSYWKRRIEVVIKEYHKWRIYYKKRVSTLVFVSQIQIMDPNAVQTHPADI